MKINSKFTFVVLCVSVCVMAVLTGMLLLVDTFGLLHQNLHIKNIVQVAETADQTKPQTFYIDSAEDLDNVREHMYQKDENGNFILTVPNIFIQICDIDMSNYSFAPIGNDTNFFNGTYIGNGFQISNLNISSTSQNVGLFAVVGENSLISGVSIVNSEISGGTNVGAIAGINYGKISLSSNYASLSGTNVGGIAGVNNGTIEKSFNAGALSGPAGGISSQNSGTIINSFNMADFLGSGIANTNSGNIINCYNAGQVSVGVASSGTVTNSYYLEGASNSGLGTALSVDAFVGFDANTLAELLNAGEENFIIDHSYSVKFESGEVNYQFPHIVDNYINVTHPHALKVSLDGRYHIIENTDMFNAIGGSYNNIPYSTSSKYILANNLDFSNKTANDIESFSGEFNGNGKTISNINKDRNQTNLGGVFNQLTYSAKISNLNLENITLNNNDDSNDSSTGVLCGRINSNVRVENVYVKDCQISAYTNAGGLVGRLSNMNGGEENNARGIYSCGVYKSSGRMISFKGEGNVTGYHPMGGFVGFAEDGVFKNCYVIHENVNGGSDNVIVYGQFYIGGFVGQTSGSTSITDSFSYGSLYSMRRSSLVSEYRDSVGGFVGINSSSNVIIQNCYSNVRVEKVAYSLIPPNGFPSITRGFGNNNGGGTFSNNYCLSQDADESHGATSTNDFSSLFSNSTNWTSNGSVGNVSNISVPNQGGIQIFADNNSTIRILKGDDEILNQTAGEVNLSGLTYGNYTVQITRYGQNDATSYTITLSADNKFSYIYDKAFYSGEGTGTSPYIITNQKQFENIGNSSAFFTLKNNINAFGGSITPNGTFSGNFDGNGKKIYNFSITSSSENVGLFEKLSNATIKNLEISSFLVTSQNASNTGTLAGKIESSQIENITIDFGNITSDSGNIGGFAGEISATSISKITSHVNITTSSQNGFAGGLVGVATDGSNISLSFSSGEIKGFNNLGGFIGNALSVAVENSYTTSSVSGETNDASTSVIGGFAGNISANSSISTSFMYGSVESLNGLGNAGVFAGVNNSNNLQNNYAWNVNNYKIVFIGNNNGVLFLSTTEFVNQSSFTGFDFTNIWTLENSNCPVIK